MKWNFDLLDVSSGDHIMVDDPRPGKTPGVDQFDLVTDQEGFAAAYTYQTAGTYRIELTLRDENGNEATATTDVVIAADDRVQRYVKNGGSDGNGGTSDGDAWATFSYAISQLTDDMTLNFNKGDTFNVTTGQSMSEDNVIIQAYGTGAAPIIKWTGTDTGGEVFTTTGENTVVRDIKFDSNLTTFTDVLPARHCVDLPNANIRATFWGVEFGSATGGFASHMNMSSGPRGVLLLKCTGTGKTRAHQWRSAGPATDLIFLGNTWNEGSTREHQFRLGFGGGSAAVEGTTISFNLLDQNEGNTKGWRFQWNNFGTILRNHFTNGSGLNISFDGAAAAKTIVDGNYIETYDYAAIIVFRHANNVMIKNNVLVSDLNSTLTIAYDTSSSDNPAVSPDKMDIINNTLIRDSGVTKHAKHSNYSDTGTPTNQLIYNNLYVVPSSFANEQFITGSVGTYQNSVYRDFGTEYTYVAGFANWAAWDDAAKTTNEQRETVEQTEITSPNFRPNTTDHPITTSNAVAFGGVFHDYHGIDRPASGSWYVGAVDSPSAFDGTLNPSPATVTITAPNVTRVSQTNVMPDPAAVAITAPNVTVVQDQSPGGGTSSGPFGFGLIR